MIDRQHFPVYPLPQHRRERRDAAEHRQRILTVARHLFTEHGVNAVSMHHIAQVAGIGQGTLYRRYRHKGALCLDLMQESHEAFATAITTLVANHEQPPLILLQSVLAQMLLFVEEQGAFFKAIAAMALPEMMCNASPEAHPRHMSFLQSPQYQWLHTTIATLLTEAVTRHELASIDVIYTADAILATLHPLLYHFQRHERGYTPEQILAGLQQIYLTGIHAQSPTTVLGDAGAV